LTSSPRACRDYGEDCRGILGSWIEDIVAVTEMTGVSWRWQRVLAGHS
jgi:hypothetical protein